jgi:site-specific DNA recombinase
MSCVRYFLYARKSEPDKSRQVESIPDQVKVLRRLVEGRGCQIVDELYEERSASYPGRPVFNRMIQRIRRGEADGILVWSINRLMRNPVDQGTVAWMVQQGQLNSILTSDREYKPGDNVLLLNVEGGSANQFILDMRKGILRGLESKVERGWFPHRAPFGYRNDKYKLKGRKTISKHPKYFAIMRRAWDLLLSGVYTVPQIQRIMNEEWGVRTPHSGSRGGRPVPLGNLYKAFHNVFYAGCFMRNGQVYKGAHPTMVSMGEYDKAQAIIGRLNPIKPKHHGLAFNGLMRCVTCQGWISGSVKEKPAGRFYTYYHCQNRTGACTKVSISQTSLAELLDDSLQAVEMLPEFYAWAAEEINREDEDIHNKDQATVRQRERTLVEVDKRLDALLELRMRDLVTDDEYIQKKNGLTKNRANLDDAIEKERQRADLARQSSLRAATMAYWGRRWFHEGDGSEKRQVAQALGSDFCFDRGRVTFTLHPMLRRVRAEYKGLEAQYRRIELIHAKSDLRTKKEALRPLISVWSSIWRDIRNVAYAEQLDFPAVTLESNAQEALSSQRGST